LHHAKRTLHRAETKNVFAKRQLFSQFHLSLKLLIELPPELSLAETIRSMRIAATKKNSQWIGFAGKILTGNHRFSHEIWVFPVNCPLKPIH
jgi:hypothetical protein